MKYSAVICLIVMTFVASFSIVAYGVHKAQVAADQVHEVICVQRDGFKADLDAARKKLLSDTAFVAAHPNGANLGDLKFTKSQLQKALQDDQGRVDALAKRYHSSDGARCDG